MNAINTIAFLLFSMVNFTVAFSQQLKLTTSSDSALYYYYEGWRQVMDEGNYTESEVAYRKMMSFDKDFLVGLSLLGRITRDLKERQDIEQALVKRKKEVDGDEQRLLRNYIELVKLTNLREIDPDEAVIQMEKVFQSAEENLRPLVHRYRDEIYYMAEYIEVLHHNHGPQLALDSLYHLANTQQRQEPFILGYAASMEAEAGNFTKALEQATALSNKMVNTQSPKPYVVYSDIYFKMGNYERAQEYIQSALGLDAGNLDAQRLERKIIDRLNKVKP